MIPDYKVPDGWRLVDYADLPKGAEYRTAVGGSLDPYEGNGIHTLVLIRDTQPDPEWLFTIDGYRMKGYCGEERGGFGVTTVGRMRNRSDLDQWEYADTCDFTSWENWAQTWEFDEDDDDEFPVIVRRVLR